MNKTKYKILFIFTLIRNSDRQPAEIPQKAVPPQRLQTALLCSVKALNKVKLRWTMIVSQNLISAI